MVKPDLKIPQILPLETQLKIVETMYNMGFVSETKYVHAKIIYDYSLMVKEKKLERKDIIEKLSEKHFTCQKNVEFIIYDKDFGCFKLPEISPAASLIGDK